MEDPPKRSFVTGEVDIKTLIAFAFGAVFVITILVFTAVVESPSPTAIWTYRVILALAAGGVAAILPGFIDVKYKTVVQAGGAIGVFVLVLLLFPAPSIAPAPAPVAAPVAAPAAGGEIATSAQDFVWPTDDPEFVARKYVDLVDNGKFLEAYEAVDKVAGYTWSSFETSYNLGRTPLGAVDDRRQTGSSREIDPAGKPKGGYAIVTYQTKFANEEKCREEVVWLKAAPTKTWHVFRHQSSPQLVDCIGLEPAGPARKD
jgi:hypothetical protein